ncbi:MAG: hypothetical protein ABI548_28625 [Polyangiaceae bacterium]
MSDDLQCGRCGAPLAPPSDFGVWLVRCQYCGFEHELADRAGRQAFAERRQREAEGAAQELAAAAQRQLANQTKAKGTRNLTLLLVGVPILLVFGVVGVVVHLVSNATEQLVTIPTITAPPPALEGLADKARAAGCGTVVVQPAFENQEYSGSFHLVHSECIRFLAVADPPAALSLYITDPTGAVAAHPGASGPFDNTYCPKATGEYKLKLRGAAQFWIEALGCTRTFGTDPESTGKTKVGAKLKQLMTHGCYQISLATETFTDERKLTIPLDAGTCFDLFAATGVPDNELKLTLSTPFGETVAPIPPTANELELPYCAASAGPHIMELSAALDGPFSAAIAICTRSVLPKTLPKAAK